MKGIKEISLCILFASVIQCNIMKILDSRSSSPNFHVHARELLVLCFPDDLNPIVISADLMDLTYEIQRNEAINSSILVIDQDFSSKRMNKYFTRHPSYLITAESTNQLQKTLQKIKSSAIWNIASVIVAVGKNCDRAAEILQKIWKIEAFKSFYVCQHKTSESFVFTFNPFTPRVPEQLEWERVELANQTNDRWTLFRQPFQNKKSICPSITFDKTRFLDEYPLKSRNYASEDKNFTGKPLPEAFPKRSVDEQYLLTELFTALNVTLVVQTKNKETVSFELEVEQLVAGQYDLHLQYNQKPDIFDVIPLYTQGSYLIITKKQSNIPAVEEVAENFLTYQITVLSIIILTIMFLLILLSYRYDFAAAFLDLVSLLLGMGIAAPINRLFMRITFLTAILFGFFFCPELQSQFTSVLTVPSAVKNVDTVQELFDNKYHIYYHPFATFGLRNLNMWDNSTLKGAQNLIRNFQRCFDRLRNDSVACVLPDHLINNSAAVDLHIAKETLFKHYNFLRTRKNFPLKSKIDKTAMNLFEAGLIEYMERRSRLKRDMKKRIMIDRVEALGKAEFLDLKSVSSFFWYVAFVVFCSCFVFLIELAMDRVRKYREKRLRDFKNKKRRSATPEIDE